MSLHQPTIRYDLPEMDMPAIFTSIRTDQDESKMLKHAKEFLGRAMHERQDRVTIVDSVRIVRTK